MDNPIKNEYNGILGIAEEDAIPKDEIYTATNKLQEVIRQRPALSKELQIYRKYVPTIIKLLYLKDSIIEGYTKTFERYIFESEARKNKRWTDGEDEYLVDMVCRDTPILEISLALGRTPASIKTRLTNLVGVKRVSKNVAGKFIGKINGILTECNIEGTIYNKEET